VTMTAADLRRSRVEDELVSARSDQPRRRKFTAEYKTAILAEYERLTEPGAKGALLRREGLYSSHIIEWRRARDAGAAAALAEQPRRPGRSPAEVQVARLRRDNERLRTELAKSRAALEVMGKAHALLELLSESMDADGRSTK
jgi:transposase